MKNGKKTQKKKSVRIICITVVVLIVLGFGIYQGYRMVRDMALEKMFVMMMDEDAAVTTSTDSDNENSGEQMSIEDAAKAFERLNGVESEEEDDSAKTEGAKAEDKPAGNKNMTNEEKANHIVTQISEADKNRAIAIVSSVASVNDCINLYNLAMNGDQNAKAQLKAIYGRFSQAQLDELWSLYEKNKHLL